MGICRRSWSEQAYLTSSTCQVVPSRTGGPWTLRETGCHNAGVSTPELSRAQPAISGRFATVKSLWMVPPRVILQRRASRTLLMHALRASARTLLVLAADVLGFLMARAALNVLQTSHRLEPIDAATRWAVPALGSAGGV